MRTNNLGTKKQNQAGYTHTKVYNNETTFKTTLLQESLNIYNNKKLLQKQVKELKRYGECNAEKCLLHVNHTCHLYAHQKTLHGKQNITLSKYSKSHNFTPRYK